MGRRGRTAGVVLALCGGLVLIAAAACGDFDEAPAPETDAGQEAAAADAPAPADASAEAAPRVVKCGDEECVLPTQVCCLYIGAEGSGTACAEGQCPPKPPFPDAGPARLVTISCDDPSDCDVSGNVCCAVSYGVCASTAVDKFECRAPAACPSCAADRDAGAGYPTCRPAIASDCPSGTCTGIFTPSYSQYSFCK